MTHSDHIDCARLSRLEQAIEAFVADRDRLTRYMQTIQASDEALSVMASMDDVDSEDDAVMQLRRSERELVAVAMVLKGSGTFKNAKSALQAREAQA